MYIPNSDPDSIDDIDVMAVVVMPIDYYFGLKQFGSRGTKEHFIREWDIVAYELKKYISLLVKANPNVLSLLWLEDCHYLKRTAEGQYLIDNRSIFATKQAYHSFTGYAYGQLKRMTNFSFEGYMGEKRRALVEKYGYDVKNAAHLIRLLRMGIEFLNEGELYVLRKDAPLLLGIKTGGRSLDEGKREAERLVKRTEDAYDRSKLPNRPDMKKVNDLCVNLLSEGLGVKHGQCI